MSQSLDDRQQGKRNVFAAIMTSLYCTYHSVSGELYLLLPQNSWIGKQNVIAFQLGYVATSWLHWDMAASYKSANCLVTWGGKGVKNAALVHSISLFLIVPRSLSQYGFGHCIHSALGGETI